MYWSDIIPLKNRVLPVFPVDALPPVYKTYATELAESYQVPADLPACLLLAVVAAAISKQYMVAGGPDWQEPCNLFVVVAQPPASRKSAIFREVTGPLEKMESKLLSKFRASVQEDDKTPPPRMIVDDVSPERLATLLAQNGGRIALFSSEGGIFETMAGRYSKGTPNLDVYLKGHAGDTLRVDRVNRSPDIVENPALTIGLTFQPEILRGLALKPGFRGRGLLGRILYSVPKSHLGHRKNDVTPVKTSSREAYYRAVEALQGGIQFEQNLAIDEPLIITLLTEAAEIFLDFRDVLEQSLGEGGVFEYAGDWGGKLAGHILRIAAILWAMDGNHAQKEKVISKETMHNAIKIGLYFQDHALHAFDLMGADPKIENAIRLLNWIERGQRDDFTLRDAHQALKGGLPNKADIESAAKLLVEHGYIVLATQPFRAGPGRKSSPIYSVNPGIYSHNSQNSEAA